VGGGFIMVPLLVLYTPLTQRQAQATSLAAIVPTSIVGTLFYYFGSRHPQVDLRFALLLVIGSVVGAYLGARLLSRLPERLLKQAFSLLLVAIGVKQLVFP
jgi:uncharacterized protein